MTNRHDARAQSPAPASCPSGGAEGAQLGQARRFAPGGIPDIGLGLSRHICLPPQCVREPIENQANALFSRRNSLRSSSAPWRTSTGPANAPSGRCSGFVAFVVARSGPTIYFLCCHPTARLTLPWPMMLLWWTADDASPSRASAPQPSTSPVRPFALVGLGLWSAVAAATGLRARMLARTPLPGRRRKAMSSATSAGRRTREGPCVSPRLDGKRSVRKKKEWVKCRLRLGRSLRSHWRPARWRPSRSCVTSHAEPEPARPQQRPLGVQSAERPAGSSSWPSRMRKALPLLCGPHKI